MDDALHSGDSECLAEVVNALNVIMLAGPVVFLTSIFIHSRAEYPVREL